MYTEIHNGKACPNTMSCRVVSYLIVCFVLFYSMFFPPPLSCSQNGSTRTNPLDHRCTYAQKQPQQNRDVSTPQYNANYRTFRLLSRKKLFRYRIFITQNRKSKEKKKKCYFLLKQDLPVDNTRSSASDQHCITYWKVKSVVKSVAQTMFQIRASLFRKLGKLID